MLIQLCLLQRRSVPEGKLSKLAQNNRSHWTPAVKRLTLICYIIAQLIKSRSRCENAPFLMRLWLSLQLLPVLHSYQCFCFRAIYFAAYSKSKEIFNGLFVPNSGLVHMSSAGVAGEQPLAFWKGKVVWWWLCVCLHFNTESHESLGEFY